MEQDVDNVYRAVCTTCLSSDRNLFSINGLSQIYQVFRLLMYDFAGDKLGESLEMEQLICWECLAYMKRFLRFKQQVHSAQEHLRVLALSRAQETVDHTYMSQSLSSLEMTTKMDYDQIFFDYATTDQWSHQYLGISEQENVKNEQYDVTQLPRQSIDLGIDEHILEGVPELVLENPVTGVMSHIIVAESLASVVKGELPHFTVRTETLSHALKAEPQKPQIKQEPKLSYITEYMTEAEMLACREEAKQKVQYASSVYKCELCIIGFYTQQQVEDHFVSAHRQKPDHEPCKVCYAYVPASSLTSHTDTHYLRYVCKLCGHVSAGERLARHHGAGHLPATHLAKHGQQGRKKKIKEEPKPPPKPGDLRKLLSKTTIEGYQCLECDMFFKSSRARKNHVARFHREGLQCDHCKKRFVNRTTLTTHLRLHEGPLPREECPICHKMVRVIQLKYHIQRHENKSAHVCTDCNKVFSHLATYQAHLKYSRAHASDNVFKYPCPMCNKGYPTKEQMQDHFNYQHLGKTNHKCPVCGKPIASRANVEKHMMRVHGEKKEKPRNHRCQQCGKGFTDKKALTQHEVIHSGERPLSCDICQQTFKQKASLYTHRKRVHKVFPSKRVVEFMDTKPDVSQ